MRDVDGLGEVEEMEVTLGHGPFISQSVTVLVTVGEGEVGEVEVGERKRGPAQSCIGGIEEDTERVVRVGLLREKVVLRVLFVAVGGGAVEGGVTSVLGGVQTGFPTMVNLNTVRGQVRTYAYHLVTGRITTVEIRGHKLFG